MATRYLRHRSAWHVLRWFLGGAAFIATAAAIGLVLFPSLDIRWVVSERWIPLAYVFAGCAALSWVGYGFVVSRLAVVPTDPARGIALLNPRDPAAEEEERDDHRRRREYWRATLTENEQTLFAQLLITPSERFRRIMEVARYAGRAIEVVTTVVIDVPEPAVDARTGLVVSGDERTMVVPVVMRESGPPDDVLKVSDLDDRRLSLLPRADMAAITSLILDRLMESALDSASPTLAPSIRAEILVAENRAWRELLFGSDAALEVARARVAFWNDAGRSHGVSLASRKLIIEAYALFSEAYPVLVMVPLASARQSVPPQPVRLRADRLEMPGYRRSSPAGVVDALRAAVGWCRRGLGVHSPVHIHSIANADRAKSYHLTVHAPDGLYVESSVVRKWLRRSVQDLQPASAAIGVSTRLARPYAHLYIQRGANLANSLAVTTFRESPPGSVGEALVTSGLFAFVLGALALGGGLFHDFEDILGGFVPLLLAAIGTTSIWQGVIQTRVPYGGRAAARISSIVTLVLAVIAVGLAVRPAILPLRNDDNGWAFELLTGLWFDAATQWDIVVGLALLNFAVIFATWAIAVRVEMRLLNRSHPASQWKKQKEVG